MSKAIGRPEKVKVTCKGNVPEKLASAGIDHTSLQHVVIPLSVDVKAEAAAIAKKVADAIRAEKNSGGVSFAELLESGDNNGKGYMATLEKLIASEIVDVANGSAVQGRAFKATFIANNKLPADIFVSTKGTAKTVASLDDFE